MSGALKVEFATRYNMSSQILSQVGNAVNSLKTNVESYQSEMQYGVDYTGAVESNLSTLLTNYATSYQQVIGVSCYN